MFQIKDVRNTSGDEDCLPTLPIFTALALFYEVQKIEVDGRKL